jgi:hypothetical protein
VVLKEFPGCFRLSFFTEFTGCQGSYLPGLVLRDDKGETVWELTFKEPFEQENPLVIHGSHIHDVMVPFGRPGRYTVVLLLNGEAVAQRALWAGLPEPQA